MLAGDVNLVVESVCAGEWIGRQTQYLKHCMSVETAGVEGSNDPPSQQSDTQSQTVNLVTNKLSSSIQFQKFQPLTTQLVMPAISSINC